MKLPAKVDYAVRAAIELSRRYENEKKTVQIAQIAENSNVPKNFLLQILIRLKNAGLVGSSRGVCGGYFLMKHPSMITLGDVVRSVDDLLMATPRRRGGGDEKAGEIVFYAWSELSGRIDNYLDGVTIDDLLGKMELDSVNYSI